jgi:hypothetical protein
MFRVKQKRIANGKQNHAGVLTPVFLLTVFLSVSVTNAQNTPEHPLEKLTIAYSSVSANMAPLWITQERNFFRKYGLDVQLVFIESGSTTVQSLIAKNKIGPGRDKISFHAYCWNRLRAIHGGGRRYAELSGAKVLWRSISMGKDLRGEQTRPEKSPFSLRRTKNHDPAFGRKTSRGTKSAHRQPVARL